MAAYGDGSRTLAMDGLQFYGNDACANVLIVTPSCISLSPAAIVLREGQKAEHTSMRARTCCLGIPMVDTLPSLWPMLKDAVAVV